MSSLISVLALLIIASFIHHFSKKIKIPYTILLFVVGAGIALLNQLLHVNLVPHFSLTPELLFYVFLPVLIFESGYSIKYHELAKNYTTIWTMAIIGILISTSIIGVGGRWLLNQIGFEVPLIIMLLFGIIISSTDPVAVLAIFKDMGVPKRLRLLFEGESLFNDGTSVALFLIILELAHKGVFTSATFFQGLGSFMMMVIGGIALGVIIGILFSSFIQQINNNEVAEITLTMVLAHLTFILAEYITHHVHIGEINIQLSGVIATAYAALIMGNYGKTKISPKVEEYMDKFWNFFAFVSNSLVFLLMGLMIQSISIPFSIIGPIIGIVILLVIIARAISIYLPLNILNAAKLHKSVQRTWQHLLAWGSLRGSLALVLVLMIPDDFMIPGRTHAFDPKSFILTLTIATIIFSLLVKGLTMKKAIKNLNMNKLAQLEQFEQYESEIIVYHRIILKIQQMKESYHISQESYDILLEKYHAKANESRLKMQVFLDKQPDKQQLIFRALSLHALGIEKQYLKEMYSYNEMGENVYHYLLAKIDNQISRVNRADQQIRGFDKPEHMKTRTRDPISWIIDLLQNTKDCTHDAYLISRSRVIVTQKVLDGLEDFATIDFGYNSDALDQVIKLYTKFNARAHQEIDDLKVHDDKEVDQIDSVLLNKGLAKTEERVITDLLAKDMITDKMYRNFMEEVEEEVWKRY